MDKHEKIPILKPIDLDDFHIKNISWNPASSILNNHLFHINKIDENISNLNFPIPPHRKTLHDIIYLSKGNSVRSKGLNKYKISTAELFFLPAFQITEHESMSANAEGYYLHFDESIFSFLPKNYLNENFQFFKTEANPVLKISIDAQNAIESLFNRILVVYKEEAMASQKLIASYLLSLFYELKKLDTGEKSKTKSAFFQITEEYKIALAKHIYSKHNVADFADMLNISPNYLNKCVKNSLNKTAQDLMNEMIILEAKALLKYSKLQIAEIAVILCNQTPSNFARFFKNQTGITPKEYLSLD